MNLRNKLLLSFLVFIAAIVAIGGWSAWRLHELGGVSQRIIANNYDSVVAAQDMKESLERMDSAALFLLLGDRDRALAQFNQHRDRFDAAFEKAANNITEPGEPQIIESIRQGRNEYYRRFEDFIAEGGKRHGIGVGYLQAADRVPRRADQRSIGSRARHNHHLHSANR